MTVINLNAQKTDRASEIEARIIPLANVKPTLSLNYLIKGWMTTNALTVLFGASNTGKTFVALDLAFHIATGTPWRGNRVQGGAVVYIAAEGGLGIQNRLSAFIADKPEFTKAELFLLPMALDLYEKIGVSALCDALPVEQPALIVVDTLARSMGDGDENQTKDMNRFVASCDTLRKTTGAHVMVVHHTGKDQTRGARGSYSLYAATDTKIKITDEREIECTKQRDMVYPDSLHFQLRSVTLGIDEDGDPVTSAVVDPCDPPKPERKPLSGKNEVAMQALLNALENHGEIKTGNLFPANHKVAHVDHWREAFADHGLTDGVSESAERQAFRRAKDKLMDMNEVRQQGDYVWQVYEEN